MPLNPSPIPTNVNHVSDRRGASPKQGDSTSASKWPLVGAAAYTRLARNEASASDPQARLKRLCYARNQLWQALHAVSSACTEHNPQRAGNSAGSSDAALYNALRALHARLEKEVLRFPLEVRA